MTGLLVSGQMWPESPAEHDPIEPLFASFTPRAATTPPTRLLQFVQDAFAIIEPRTPFVSGRHIRTICLHLERLTYYAREALTQWNLLTPEEIATWADIENLLVNIPPRYMKSLLVAVMWPAWVWTLDPGARFLFNSYSQRFSIRDNVKTRRVVESGWYQDRWGDRVKILQGSNEKMRFDLEGGGFRIASSVEGGNTGEGGDYNVADDPHNAKKIWSQRSRAQVVEWWDDVMSSRTGRFPTNRKVAVMQRLHEEDLAGHLLAERGNYVHLFLPQEYDPNLRPGRAGVPARSLPSPLGPVEWRTQPGELLWPERFTAPIVRDIRRTTSAYAYGGQYQQVPSPAEGTIFKRVFWRFWEPPNEHLGPITLHRGGTPDQESPVVVYPRKLPFKGDYYAQSWDFTFKGKRETQGPERDYVAGWVWFKSGPDAYVMDRLRQRMDFPATIRALRAVRRRWPRTQRTFYEDTANGPAIGATLRTEIPGMIPVGTDGNSLESLAHTVTWLQESGHLYLPHPVMCPWVWEVIEIFSAFPGGAHDDDVAAAVVGLRRMYPVPPQSPERLRDTLRNAGRYPVFQSR